MPIGTAPQTADTPARPLRAIDQDEWASAGIPLLANPRELVKDLSERHLPAPSTTVVAVLDAEGRLSASASFAQRAGQTDGWERRNAILYNLRRVTPDDLRRRAPVRTAVLLVCREGPAGWTPADGAWMWGLRDACVLHGLRCGAYITLTGEGWRVLGEDRGGRTPSSASWTRTPLVAAPFAKPGRVPEAVRRAAAR
jgi:hypothetical protein